MTSRWISLASTPMHLSSDVSCRDHGGGAKAAGPRAGPMDQRLRRSAFGEDRGQGDRLGRGEELRRRDVRSSVDDQLATRRGTAVAVDRVAVVAVFVGGLH